MTTETTKLKSRLTALNASLDDLESAIAPLLSQSLPESTLLLSTIQQAKLQTVIPYVVYDLIFVYLKARGVDPKTHPVFTELDRVRRYFDKIKDAEDPAKRDTKLDTAAANRFIKHAVTQATYTRPQPHENDPVPEAGPSRNVRVAPVVTSKMKERAEYEKRVREEDEESGSEEGDVLEVFEDGNEERGEMKMGGRQQKEKEETKRDKKEKTKGKGKGRDNGEAQAGEKRRHREVDHFAGWGDSPRAIELSAAIDPKPKKKKATAAASTTAPPSTTDPGPTSSSKSSKKTKKKSNLPISGSA